MLIDKLEMPIKILLRSKTKKKSRDYILRDH